MTRSTKSQLLRLFINIRVVGGAVVIASCLTLASLLILFVSRSSGADAGQVTAVLTLIAAPPATQTAPPVAESSATAVVEEELPTPMPGLISLGGYVQIVGTGGDGLRLRDQPGLDGKVLLLGSEAEVFRVQDGPRQVDGYTWWYLVGPFDETRRGWAVANYLQIVQNP